MRCAGDQAVLTPSSSVAVYRHLAGHEIVATGTDGLVQRVAAY